MKLLDSLQDVVNAIGPVRKAWFTTFSFNIDLIESYIAPVLVGADFPKSPSEYESLQQQLFPVDGQAPIDIRVFYDIRTSPRDRIKKTSISLHGVDFRSPNLTQREKGLLEEGFFHPKVIYLTGDRGEFIGAGSANLTIDGWGKNRECFTFQKLNGRSNRIEVYSFFRRIFAWCALDSQGQFPVVGRDERENRKWHFVSSLSSSSFLDHLSKGHPDMLTVWTPYLSSDLAGLADEIQKRQGCFQNLAVVPDLIDGNKLRTTQEVLDSFLAANKKENQRKFLFDASGGKSSQSDASQRFTHAKVWLTPNDVAIGSWNLTRSALGFHSSRNNVEAGIVLVGEGGHPSTALKSLASGDVEGWSVQDAEDNAAALGELQLPPLTVTVTFDWIGNRSWSWMINSSRNSAVLAALNPMLILSMPKGDEQISLARRPDGTMSVDDCGFMLKQRSVALRLLQGDQWITTPVWINELHPEERPATKFGSWEDLISSLIEGLPEQDPRGRDSIELDEDVGGGDGGSGVGDPMPKPGEHRGVSYFRMFAAMKGARLLLRDAKDPVDLRRRITTYPGCVREIVEASAEVMNGTEAWSPLYRWFLVHELNSLVRDAKKIWNKAVREQYSNPLAKIEFKSLTQKIPALPKIAGIDNKHAELFKYAMTEASYR